MGAGVTTLAHFDPAHVRIYKNILQIQNPKTRVEMIQTVLAGPEYIQTAKAAAVYSSLLAYVARVQAGQPPPQLPGELPGGGAATATAPAASQRGGSALAVVNSGPAASPAGYITKSNRNEKAMNYFQNCLLVLGLEEEVALTEESLRSAYKRAAVKAHPDKGGSEQEFEAVTRAHAYLGDILRRIKGGRAKEGVVEAPDTLRDARTEAAREFEQVQPVRLNPQKLDLDAFNKMFEQTRMPDPDDTGYGDWLKNEGGQGAAPTFSGKFNRDVFNSAFEEEARRRVTESNTLSIAAPQALTLSPTQGVELGRGAAGDFTAPAGAGVRYTDLRSAYTTENLITNKVANVRFEARSFEQVAASRKRAPDPLSNTELEAITQAERQMQRQEDARKLRAAQEMSQADQYFQRMKQLVLTGGTGGSSAGAAPQQQEPLRLEYRR